MTLKWKRLGRRFIGIFDPASLFAERINDPDNRVNVGLRYLRATRSGASLGLGLRGCLSFSSRAFLRIISHSSLFNEVLFWSCLCGGAPAAPINSHSVERITPPIARAFSPEGERR